MSFLEDEKKLNLRSGIAAPRFTEAEIMDAQSTKPVQSSERFTDEEVADFQAQMKGRSRQAQKEADAAVEVERSLPGEIGASLVRGGLGIAKLVPQVGKIIGSDVAGPIVKGITGRDLAKEAFTPMIEGLEDVAASPTWKPSTAAGGTPIDLERIVSNPGEVVGQITSQIANPRFWASQLPEGAMSMIPAIVGAWAPRAAAMAGKLGTALEAANAAGKTAEATAIATKIQRLSTIGMYGASMAMEAGQGEEKVREYEEKTGEKIPWGSRVASILGTGVIAGGLEAFSLGRVLPSALLGRKAANPLAVIENVLNGKGGREIVNKVLAGVATEGLTEGAQSIVENAFPRGFFDKNQKLLEGVVESMLIGAALGGLGGGVESVSTHREAGAFAREGGEFSKEFQDTAVRIQDAIKKAQDEYYSQYKPILPEKPPEPALAPRVERPGPQPVAPTPEEQQQAIFGGELGRIAGEQPTLSAAVDNLAPLVGGTDRAERFYDLYQQGDAATALQEFPEFSSFATEQQREAAITPAERAKGLPSAFTGRPRPTAQAGPMGVTAAMAATRATTPAPEAAGTPTPGSPPSPGTAASGPTTPPAPMGVTGGMAHTLATRRGEETGAAIAEEVLAPIRDQAALRDQVLDRTGGIIPQTRLRRMAMQEIEGRLVRGEEVEPEVLARFPELAKKYETGTPSAPEVEAAAPVLPQEALEVEDWAESAPPLANAPDETGIVSPEASDASTEGVQEGGKQPLWAMTEAEAIKDGRQYSFIQTDKEAAIRWDQEVGTALATGEKVPESVVKEYLEKGGSLQGREKDYPNLISKPLPSAITGKKVGPAAGAKPVAGRGVGLHPGITGKPAKSTPAPTPPPGENVAPAASEKVAPENQAGPTPKKPLPSAFTGKKGAVAKAKPVTKHPGLPKGIGGKGKVAGKLEPVQQAQKGGKAKLSTASSRFLKREPGITDGEYADQLIARGQELQELANKKYRQEGEFNLYTARGRKLNDDAGWLIQAGLNIKKKLPVIEVSKSTSAPKQAQATEKGDSENVFQGMKDWLENKAYIDNAGNYRLSETKKIAPWNKEVKAAFPNAEGLSEAAQKQYPEIVKEKEKAKKDRAALLDNKQTVNPKINKDQKEFALNAVHEQFEKVADAAGVPQNIRDDLSKGTYGYRNTPEGFPDKVTIKIPGDGTFIINNNPHSLAQAEAMFKKWPISTSKPNYGAIGQTKPRGFKVEDFEIKEGKEPEIPWELEQQGRDVKQGVGLGSLIKDLEGQDDPHANRLRKWAEARLKDAEAFNAQEEKDRGETSIVSYLKNPEDPYHISYGDKSRAIEAIKKYPDLAAKHNVELVYPKVTPKNEPLNLGPYKHSKNSSYRETENQDKLAAAIVGKEEGYTQVRFRGKVQSIDDAISNLEWYAKDREAAKRKVQEKLAIKIEIKQVDKPAPAQAQEGEGKVAGKKYSLTGRTRPAPGEGPTITLQAVQERFGGVKVHELEGGKGFHLTLPNGKLLMILTGQDLTARRDEILATYGREMKAGEWVAGEWRPMSVGGVIALAKGTGTRTLDHETFHAACDLVLTKGEWEAVLRKYGDWERAARAYEVWKPAESHKFFQKVLNFFRRLAQLIGPTAHGTFAKIKSGEVWTRTAAGVGTDTTGLFRVDEAPKELVERLTVKVALLKGRMTKEQYNAQYADKYGKWGSPEWSENIDQFADIRKKGGKVFYSLKGKAFGMKGKKNIIDEKEAKHGRKGSAANDQHKGTERDDLSQIKERARRELADFRARENQADARIGRESPWQEVEFSESLADSPDFQNFLQRAKAHGIDLVIPIKSPTINGYLHQVGNEVHLLLNENPAPHSIEQVFTHEVFHYDAQRGGPDARAILQLIDYNSEAFKSYRQKIDIAYKRAGFPLLESDVVAEELGAEFVANRLQDNSLLDAFKDKGSARDLRSSYLYKSGLKGGQAYKQGSLEERYSLANAQATLDSYHRTVMAQDPASKSLWRRFWDKDPALKASWTEMSQKAYDQVVDRFAPGERAQDKLAKAGLALPAGEQFTSTIGFWRGQEGWNHEAVLGSGIYADKVETLGTGESFFTGATPTRVGDSLFKRVDPIRALAKTRSMENKEVFRDLRLLMVAQRDLELAGETGARAPGEIKGVRPDESRAALQALETKYGNDFSQLQEVADGIREWADQAILQRLVQGGIITQDLYDKIKAKNQAYVPFARLMDELDQYIKSTGGGKVIKEIKGSERAIVDPFQMLIELSAKANYAYAKNRMIRSLYQMGQASPEMGIKELKPKIIPSGMVRKDKWEPLGKSGWAMERELPLLKKGYAFSQLPPEPGAIPFYRDGKRSWLKLPPDLYGMTQNLLPEDLGLLMRVLKWPADVLRTGAVTTPEFGLIKNPLRDLVQAWLFNRAGFSPAKWFRDLYLTLSKDPATVKMKAEMAAGGGFMATLAQSTVDEKITAEDIEGKKKNIAYAAHPVEALRTLSAYLENLTRFSLYKQARENGLSHAEAIHEARRTTLDFRRLGGHPVARYLNMIIPFWNASIQGTDKLITELQGPNKAAVMRRLGTIMAASVGLALLFHGDDRLKELEDWEKNYFWHIPLGKTGPIIRLPKPFEAGILFGSVPERLVEVAMGDNTTGLQAAVKAAVDALTPEVIPAILRPMVELKSNYNFFLGRPIEDAGLQNLPVELRSKPWTTPLAKAISAYGGSLIGLSPVKIEHFVRSFSGGLGANYYFPGADLLLRKAGVLEDLPNPQQDAIERAFGIRALFTKPPAGYRAKSVGDFFENVQGATQADQGWKLLWNTGSMDKLDAFLKDNPEAMFARVARKQMAELGKIKKERNAIHTSKALTSEQKKAKLDALDEKIVTLARAGNALMDPAVAEAVKMPARKGMNFDSYKKMTSEFVGDAYDIIQKNLPKIVHMEEAQRQRYLIKIIRQAQENYKPILKKPKDETKLESPYATATRAERARWQSVMGFRKAKSGEASGYRLKEEGL